MTADSIYLVTVTSQAVGGSTETLCAHVNEPKEPLSIVVTLRTDDRNLTILQQGSIKKDFYKCVRFKFRTVELQDPYSNRIGQWLNRTTSVGILDLSYSMSPEAAQGYYTINAWDDKNQQISHGFEIKEYVLPKYEVNIDFPSVITNQDKEVTLKVCAKYTYGKPVLGSVNAEVCGQSYGYYWRRRPLPEMVNTDKTGCGSQVINVTEFGLSSGGSFQVNCNVEESGTGLTMQGSTSAVFTSDYVSVHFEDTPDTYRPGMAFKGKVVVTNSQSSVMKNVPVILYAQYGEKSVNMTLTTDINGTARFSFNTSSWSELPVELRAHHKEGKEPMDFEAYRYYPSGYHYVRPFHSNSKSFLMLTKAPEKLSCNSDATVTASYIISSSALKTGQKTLDFFYIVLSRGSMVQNGRLSVNTRKENKGELTFLLKNTAGLTPYAQVVVYTVLPSGETVADSMDFPIEECLPNKVSLKFSSSTALPGEKTSLNLKASPGSLCSVRAIDQSVLLLRPEAELDAATVLGMLPVQILSGYPYNVEEWEPNHCLKPWEIPAELARRKRSILPMYFPYYVNKNDVYNIFRGVGVKIATNTDVKAPVVCHHYNTLMKESIVDDSGRIDLAGPEIVQPVMGSGSNMKGRAQKIRESFPETWIWDLLSVGKSGSVDVAKTVPDTITKFAAGAFCTSNSGFGVAPKTHLTVFKPFFVSLALPYSVIREETFTLKATVFNYLPKCIMVKVTLANSPQFTAQPCRGCTYTQCVCSEESQTFQWIVTPSELGKVNITVRAEAVQSRELCGNEVVTLPDKGRVDAVMQSVLVEAEGTKQSITQNELICLTDRPQETSVSLTLPKVFVKGSAKSFVTVLGDLMGRALKNIGDLLAMPYGCGEQNMLNFAPNIYILQYLESSGQLTPEIKKRAITFLESGYQRELTYKHDDGSYSAFGRTGPSGNTWLTAFVMKSFGGAKKYIFIDQANIDQAKDWLKQHQQENGCFASVGTLFNNMLKGGVSDEVTLSAYITAALLELGVPKTDEMVVNSLRCLKESSRNVANIYATALLSYTFTLAGDEPMRQNLLSTLDQQAKRQGVGRYWTMAGNDQPTGSVEVETSAYVLLALLSGPTLPGFGLNYSAGIVHWLSKQQNAYGGFSSTQDTVVALQALAKYSTATYNPEGSITVTVTSPSGQRNQFTVNRNNRLLYQEKQLQEATGSYKLRAEGAGCVFVQFALHYNIPPPPDSLAFKINANTGVCSNTRSPAFTLTTTVGYNGTRAETNMVIINVRLLSGYKPDETSLQALREDPTIRRLDLDADRVIFYLDSLKKNENKSISLKLVQEVPVQNLRPAVVIVYDYYKISAGHQKSVPYSGSQQQSIQHRSASLPLLYADTKPGHRSSENIEMASIYLVTVTSQAVGGSTETLCAQIHEPKEPLSIVVTLRTDDRNLTILQQASIKKDFYKCVPFKVPLVTAESVASVDVAFQTVELEDPYSNRIGQWLNQTTRIGILDLSHSMSPEAAQGYYTINAWDEKNQQISHGFEIKEYVLPKYEVNINFPSVITIQDKEVTLKVCAKYTYGKPVLGSVNAKVCGQDYGYYWRRPLPDMVNVCKTYSMMTDKTGCGSQVINVTEFGLSSGGSFQVNCNVEESGTGLNMKGSTSAVFTSDYISVHFEDTPDTYRPGMAFKGKVVVTNPQSSLMKNEPVVVYAFYGDKKVNVTLTTDINGTARFSFNTSDWSTLPVELWAYHRGGKKRTDFEAFTYYPSSYLYVLSRGSMVQNDRLSVSVNNGKENKGELTFTLKKTAALTPYAQVVVYTVLPNRETVADSMDFPIEECLPNKVSLQFSSPTALPGEKTSLNLKANPGSLCSVRAIDQSVLLLRPEAELDAAAAFRLLPFQSLSGYPYEVDEWEPYPCLYPWEEIIPFAEPARRKRSLFRPYYGNRNDVYNIFRAVGIKIATNSDIKELRICQYGDMSIGGRDVMEDMKIASSGIGLDPNVEKHSENMRKFFPETWIWDLISVGQSGSVDVAKTVPDAITKWAAGAFCTSRVGFGVAPKTNLTAFKPFFVSLALPYSVIREETFTLKATVFNYLPKCIMVKVTLAGSPQFTAQPCKDCTYTQCVCSEESQTFQWIVTPSDLGKVNITVRAEAVQSRELCGNEVVTFPDKGRIDTVMQSILVAAEGTKQSISQNEAICVTDCPQETSVSLTLPKVFVKDSAKSFITVLGDLMGRALKNIGDLLAMPYGCGEQNMLNFAPNIYILQYLESSGQLTPEIKKRAITFLQSGYQGQLKYKHYDGSYSAFGTSDPSGNTWLTAFVMKSFGGAKKYIFIDQTNIDQAKNWLKRRQQENGCFASVGKLYHIGMMGGVNDEVTLSAYITAALLELGVQKTDEMVAKSLACLKQSSLNITNTYVTALLSYTFTLAGDEQMRQNLLSKLDKQAKREGVGRYWTLTNNVQPTGSVEVETSAYVLLALLSGPTLPGFGLNYSVGIVHWLTKNQNAYGGFSSTQDTVVALQALAKYSASTYNPEGSITVTVTSPSGQNNQFTVNQNNRLLYQEKQLQEATGTYKLRAEGKGCVFVQFALHYNIPPPPDSLAFKINASTGVCSDTRNPAFTLTTTARYSGTRAETNMVIINVRLLSGYKPDETSLQALREDPTIKRLDLDADHVFFYLDSLKKNQKSISLQLAQEVPVQNLKPAVVIVYDYYKIIYPKQFQYQVPVVTVESVASVDVVIRGNKTSLNKTTNIVINPPSNLLFIQSDKPIYKPGQTIKFRIVSLDSNFLPRNQMFRTVELQDPYSNRIGQWLNRTTRIGILDLSHSMSPEAAQGYYTINAWDDKNQQISHGFEIKEYVLPKYEVNIDFPSVITNQDKEVTLKVCAKYTYGKPVLGSVNAKTGKTGCGSQLINVTEFGLSSGGSFQVNCNVEESGTGITMQGSTSGVIIHDYISVHFEDTVDTYRPGMIFKGKVMVTNSQSRPMKNEPVIVYAHYGGNNVNVTLTTDINGTGHFSFNTSDWAEQNVQLQVLSRGRSVRMGSLSVSVNTGKENKGELTFLLKNTAGLTPYAQVVVYTVLPNRETVADSMNFPIEECLPNKVSLNVSSPTALPGEKISLNLKANPGSLCSVRAIDQSVLLLRPEAELNTEFVFRMLPVQILSGYPYNIEELEPYPCRYPWEVIPFAEPARRKRSRIYYPYYDNKNDVYNIFKAVGIKIATNSDVKAPVVCRYYNTFKKESIMDNGGSLGFDVENSMRVNMPVPDVVLPPKVEERTENIRKSFLETWIWDLIPVGKSGSVDIAKTVPDTITKWAAGAFCTSNAGFGVAPKTDLIAFKPFFVSLTLPYSVIREETFTLKATVFNYLPKCIMVKVTLADSPQFTAQPCKGCTYTQCVCSEESQTFQWIVTPSELGKVNITVRAEAVKSQELCGNEVVTLPDKGRVDAVMQSVLVQAEGTKQSVTQNELICLTDGPYNTSVSLTLPKVFVKDSAKCFITVLGDLMGRALKNIADLLAMPYGCGEQNMLVFAPNIYILQYLESSGQLTPEIKNRAITFLQSGYQRELTYKHYDGSYSAFGMSDPSGNTWWVWLTAFVMKSFGGAKKYIFIDQTNIDQAKDWLKRQQKENGCFASVGTLYHIDMMGGVNDEVSLSAYITAALLELGIPNTNEMVAKSLVCLKEYSRNITNTYVTALLSYTFTLAGDEQMRQNLLSKLDQQASREGVGRYWTMANNAQPTGSVEVETSAYVLLALLSGPTLPGFGLDYSAGIVHWLTKKQNAYGGFSSTQDTVVALQALAKYSAAIYNPEGTITVTVTSPSGQRIQFTVNRNNRLLYQEKQLQEATGTYKLRAEGKGCVFVQFALHYNIPPPPDSLAFKISASTVCNNTVNPAFTLNTTVRYDGTRAETNMVIINVRLLSGYKPDETSLQALREDPTIKRLDLDADHVFFYLDSLKKNQVKSISLKLVQEVPVQNLKPAVVIVYDYYKTSEMSVIDYTSPCA
ncbi:alpha-2-macroglobulin 1 [Labeo rohita]|uniref:Alpha-2-macroglobulin 1 n=1 Tax=Labeo rohita TaxID=84645 RepID=A0A498NDT3_LABRO|nr:alpha-2-macroglobulin 1 [Labeo rohita]